MPRGVSSSWLSYKGHERPGGRWQRPQGSGREGRRAREPCCGSKWQSAPLIAVAGLPDTGPSLPQTSSPDFLVLLQKDIISLHRSHFENYEENQRSPCPVSVAWE